MTRPAGRPSAPPACQPRLPACRSVQGAVPSFRGCASHHPFAASGRPSLWRAWTSFLEKVSPVTARARRCDARRRGGRQQRSGGPLHYRLGWSAAPPAGPSTVITLRRVVLHNSQFRQTGNFCPRGPLSIYLSIPFGSPLACQSACKACRGKQAGSIPSKVTSAHCAHLFQLRGQQHTHALARVQQRPACVRTTFECVHPGKS